MTKLDKLSTQLAEEVKIAKQAEKQIESIANSEKFKTAQSLVNQRKKALEEKEQAEQILHEKELSLRIADSEIAKFLDELDTSME